MKRCPACGSRRIKEYAYEEGAVALCRSCRLQWGSLAPDFRKRADVDIMENTVWRDIYRRYIDPQSIPSARDYPPYADFFRLLTRLKGNRRLKILDVGCRSGVFLEECLRRGHDILGVEADESLRRRIPPKVRDRVVFSPVEKLATFEGLFDVVTFWDSFEHLTDGFGILELLRTAHMKKDALIFLRVNNNRDVFNLFALLALAVFPPLGRRAFKTCFNFPAHLWNFSKDGMRGLLDKKGWRMVSCRFTETPASRFTRNPLLRGAIRLGYLCNRIIGGGKIGEYFIVPR